jgi:metal-responsive CopG/Arc/MetJ family transcriptional regulator
MDTVSITLPPQLKALMDNYIEEQSSMFGWDRSEYIRLLIANDLKRVGKL